MRWAIMLALGLGLSAVAAPACVGELKLPVGDAVAPPEDGSGGVPKAARGQYLGLSCSAIERASDDGVAVVLFPDNGVAPTGIAGVLATDQKVEPGIVHVRVPDFPELADHTARVKVYLRDGAGTHVCDGGSVKIN